MERRGMPARSIHHVDLAVSELSDRLPSVDLPRHRRHLAFYVDSREEEDAAYQRCLDIGARIHFPPKRIET
jgi:hypothetical protein